MINVLVVGSGAREHALAWKIAQSPRVERLYVAPGNPGTAQVATNISLEAIDIDGICRFCTERRISLVVIGPEAPLALGLADALRRQGQRVVGPDAAAARIESSKSFAKDLMSRAGVPTAQYAVFDELAAALDYADTAVYPLVVKADGLAAGKGVVICHAPAEAHRPPADDRRRDLWRVGKSSGDRGDAVRPRSIADGAGRRGARGSPAPGSGSQAAGRW